MACTLCTMTRPCCVAALFMYHQSRAYECCFQSVAVYSDRIVFFHAAVLARAPPSVFFTAAVGIGGHSLTLPRWSDTPTIHPNIPIECRRCAQH